MRLRAQEPRSAEEFEQAVRKQLARTQRLSASSYGKRGSGNMRSEGCHLQSSGEDSRTAAVLDLQTHLSFGSAAALSAGNGVELIAAIPSWVYGLYIYVYVDACSYVKYIDNLTDQRLDE